MRLNHAILDKESREKKTAKIVRVIQRRKDMTDATVLEIGTGSGVAAASLAEVVGKNGAVFATDVKDQRIVTEGYEFRQVNGTTLPFADEQFDVVISNHVIEHVGNEHDQRHHLTEIKRVMKPDGLLYLAVPNKWRLIEPHYRIPLLSWLPKKAADAIVRVTGKNEEFDCRSPSRWELRKLFAACGLVHEELDREALKAVASIESSGIAAVMSRLPGVILNTLLLVVPTFIVVARKAGAKYDS